MKRRSVSPRIDLEINEEAFQVFRFTLNAIRFREKSLNHADFTLHCHDRHLLRAMDALIDEQQRIDVHLATLLRPLIDTELSVVFYDLTTIRAEGLSEQPGEVRRYGRLKHGGVRRQFVLGVVQSADGLPIRHEVLDDNVAEVCTLKETLERVMARLPIRRVMAVAIVG